ncbi:hypothetical protein M3Y97_00428100 [Aphelenchoides bicaudatus]|nr:hypothetical protein M3Y97_00428100 [Aphelenchoides bicaudatus]
MLTNGSENHVEKQKVLHTIKKVLENYSDDAIRKIFASTETAPVTNEELTPVEFATTSTTESAPTTNDHKFHDALEDKLREEDANSITTTLKPRNSGMMRIRAGISRSSSTSSSQQQPDERPLNRQYRSARHDWLQHHRRKKGCPPMHGRDQLLCPTRNTRKYDVCISREQLCDHVIDCPGGEDESVEQCFFYKPLDDQLKTLSHAVLLLVDSIMADSQQRKQEL